MQLESGLRIDARVAGGLSGRERHTATIIWLEHVQKCVVQSIDKGSFGTEICSQLERVENELFIVCQLEAAISYASEQFGVGIAEGVNGLHRITDQEEGATGLIGPRSHEGGKKLMLAPAGVLEFIDKEVANVISCSDCDVGGRFVSVRKYLLCDLGYFNEIDGACLGKDGSQVARCLAQQGEACLDYPPIFLRVASRGETANPMKG